MPPPKISRFSPNRGNGNVNRLRASSMKLDRKNFWEQEDRRQQQQQQQQQPVGGAPGASRRGPLSPSIGSALPIPHAAPSGHQLQIKERRGLIRRSGSFGAASLRISHNSSCSLLPITTTTSTSSNNTLSHSGSSQGQFQLLQNHQNNSLLQNQTNGNNTKKNGNSRWFNHANNIPPSPGGKHHSSRFNSSNNINNNSTASSRPNRHPRRTVSMETLLCAAVDMNCLGLDLKRNNTDDKWGKKKSRGCGGVNNNNNNKTFKRRLLRILSFLLLVGIIFYLISICFSMSSNVVVVERQAIQRQQPKSQQQQEQLQQQPTTTPPTKKMGLRNSNASYKRDVHRKMVELLLSEGITTADRLDDPFGPAAAALEWLVDSSIQEQQWAPLISDHDIITRFSLATLFYATHTMGSMWTHEQNWVHTTGGGDNQVHVCDWYGIECAHNIQLTTAVNDDFSETVTHIRLPNNQLQGTLPAELVLGLRSDLIVLDLSHNQLWGPLPPAAFPESQGKKDHQLVWQLEQSWQLQSLRLDQNAMTGSIPLNLLGATQLKELRLEHNHFLNGYDFRLLFNNADHDIIVRENNDEGGDGGNADSNE